MLTHGRAKLRLAGLVQIGILALLYGCMQNDG